MALSVQTLLDNAYVMALPYGDIVQAPRGALLRELTQLEHEIVELYELYAPERLSTAAADITIVAASNADGYTLQTNVKRYTNFVYKDRDGNTMPVLLLTEDQLDDAPSHPSGLVRGDKFYPADPLSMRWVGTDSRTVFIGDGDKLSYRYISNPTAITALSQSLVSPDETQPYLQWSLVLTILLASTAPAASIARVSANRDRAWLTLNLMASKRAGV